MSATITRRDLLAGTSAMLAASAVPLRAAPPAAAVRPPRRNGAASSAARGTATSARTCGTRPISAPTRHTATAPACKRELDRLAGLGINSVRMLGSSELSPLKNSVRPTFRDRTSHYNETLLGGLDFALAEMGKRDMKAVIYLANFWEWSGGFMTYLYWTNGGRYINMNDPAHPWPEFPDMSSEFYGSPTAVAMLDDYIRAVVGRTNSDHRPALFATIPRSRRGSSPTSRGPAEAPKPCQRHMPAYLAVDRRTRRG